MGNNVDERRIAKIRCSVTVLTQMVLEYFSLKKPGKLGVPKDLTVIGVNQSFQDYLDKGFEIVYVSESNPIVPDGQEIPLNVPDKNVKTD